MNFQFEGNFPTNVRFDPMLFKIVDPGRKSMLKCGVCENPSLCCFCFCPYCGDAEKNCMCKVDESTNFRSSLRSKDKPKHHLPKQMKDTSSFLANKDEDWWRLEKWQIGRKKFLNLF